MNILTNGIAPLKVMMTLSLSLLGVSANTIFHDVFDGDTLAINTNVGGGSTSTSNSSSSWVDDGQAVYNHSGISESNRATLYSINTFQSDTGFKLTVNYTSGSLGDTGANNFSFGLIKADGELQSPLSFNPFKTETNVDSLGINLSSDEGAQAQGLNLTSKAAATVTTLDASYDGVDDLLNFVEGAETEITLEIGKSGIWSYAINGEQEASGMIAEGFDLESSYHIAVYGQDNSDGMKSIQSIKLEERKELGDRADWIRGSWGLTWTPSNYENGNVENVTITPFLEQIKDVKTVEYIQVKLGSSYTYSPVFSAPNQVLESLWRGDIDSLGAPMNLVVPRWVDSNSDNTPDNDPFLSWLLAIKKAGFRTQIYVNSSNMLQRHNNSGRLDNPPEIPNISERWKEYCDNNYADFIKSEPFHTGIYDASVSGYTDSETTYPERKYMFCFAEFILKEYALRYGDLIDAWCFDSGEFMEENGDHNSNGILEDQRIYEAFTLAARAGNPDVAVCFNNGPNRLEDNAANGRITTFSKATHFDDYMFGHPYNGGRNIGRDKEEYLAGATNTNYGRNYSNVLWMEETGGNVHIFRDLDNPVNEFDWDDRVIGHFYPPMSTTSWQGGNTAALEQVDFNLWNEKAIESGGTIVWGVALNRSSLANLFGGLLTARDWAYEQIMNADDHLCSLPNPESLGAPRWARGALYLPPAILGQAYYHTITGGEHFWDPEGDDILSLTAVNATGSLDWLTITESPTAPGSWVFSGTPTEAHEIEFELLATDSLNNVGSTTVEFEISESTSNFLNDDSGIPLWASSSFDLTEATLHAEYSQILLRGRDFEDFDGDDLDLVIVDGPSWLTLRELSEGVWELHGTPSPQDEGPNGLNIRLTDGSQSVDANAFSVLVSCGQYMELAGDITPSLDPHWTREAPFAEFNELTYNNNGRVSSSNAFIYTEETVDASSGFKLTVNYTIGSIEDQNNNHFSFGLFSTTDQLPESFSGSNPFADDTSVYSLGINLTATSGDSKRGLNFTNGSSVQTLDQSGTNIQFLEGQSVEIILEVYPDGSWNYSINGIIESSGSSIPGGFDLTKDYVIGFYAQSPNGDKKSIQSFCFDQIDISNAFSFSSTLPSSNPVFIDFAEINDDTRGIYNVIDPPLNGTLERTSSGQYVYTPGSDDWSGDSFTYINKNSEIATVTLSLGKVAHWKMDEEEGDNIQDSFTQEFGGLLVGGDRDFGFSGCGISLGGRGEHIRLPKEAFEPVTQQNAITITMWAYGDAQLQPNQSAALRANDSNGNRVLTILLPWQDGRIYWDAGNQETGVDRLSVETEPINYAGRWNHWAFTKNGDEGIMRIYLNGELYSAQFNHTSEIGEIAEVFLGSSNDGNFSYSGVLDEVELYANVLDADQIARIYGTHAGYYTWLIENETIEASAMLEDSDYDGLENLLEYVYGTNPNDTLSVTSPRVEFNGEDFMFSYSRNADSANDTEQILEYSEDLETWSEFVISPSSREVIFGDINNGVQSVDMELNFPHSNKMFFRLKVSHTSQQKR